jgi:hypothetical protein
MAADGCVRLADIVLPASLARSMIVASGKLRASRSSRGVP